MNNDLDFRKIGTRIQKYRLERNMTQEDLAEMIDSSQKYLSTVESGKHRLSLDSIITISKALGVSINKLIADFDDSSDENNLQDILNEIRGMSALQLEMLRDIIKVLKKMDK